MLLTICVLQGTKSLATSLMNLMEFLTITPNNRASLCAKFLLKINHGKRQ